MRTQDRYVYHPSWEPNPHPYASAGENVVGLGYIMPTGIPMSACPEIAMAPCPGGGTRQNSGPPCYTPVGPCSGGGGEVPTGPGIIVNRWPVTQYYPPYPGATNLTPQPPPPTGPIGWTTVNTLPPISPQPAPVLTVPSSQTAPQLVQPGTTLDSSGASVTTTSGIGAWLEQSSLISGIPNWGIAAAVVFAGMMFMGKGRR